MFSIKPNSKDIWLHTNIGQATQCCKWKVYASVCYGIFAQILFEAIYKHDIQWLLRLETTL